MDYAESKGYRVDFRIMSATAFSVKLPSGECGICIDPTKGNQLENLAHEVGHCETDSFYTSISPWETIGRCEAKADKWAIKKLVPKDELQRLIADHRDMWEICDILGISADFLQKAILYYEKI